MPIPRTIPELFYQKAKQAGQKEIMRVKRQGQWQSITWNDVYKNVMTIARSLSRVIEKDDMVAILSENRPEWAFADLASVCLGGVSVPIYHTNSDKEIEYILNDCKAKVLFLSDEGQFNKIKRLHDKDKLEHLKKIICFDLEPLPGNAAFLSLEAFKKQADGVLESVVVNASAQVTEEDLLTLIYTSGTTGEPKGVMLTHKNIISNIMGIESHGQLVTDEDISISFLPLSHSFERTCGYYYLLYKGAIIAYAESVDKLIDNIAEVRPTILISVPRIYEKVYSKVRESVGEGPKQVLFNWAIKVGQQMTHYAMKGEKLPTWLDIKFQLANTLIFEKIREKLGGRLKYSISGGAPLAQEIAEFMYAVGLSVYEGYGLSETSPVISANFPGKVKFGTVGRPLPNLEVKIIPEPGREKDGEIAVRGPSIMRGYYKKEDQTKSVLTKDGWLLTGDIGYLDEDGFLKITDRKKELLKTSGGKYVAPQPVENQLKLRKFIEQAVVIGDRRKYVVALIVPDFDSLEKWATERNISFNNRKELVNHPDVKTAIQLEINAVNAPLGKWEQIKYFAILDQSFSQDTGELTPTLKLKRRVIEEKYKDIIENLYKE